MNEADEGRRAQKALMAAHDERVARAREEGRKVVYTFVPGNLVELLLSFDLLPVYPEIHALRAGMRGTAEASLRAAEERGYPEDVCSYVKCDVGAGLSGGRRPDPDLLLISTTGCFTFMKWFEALRRRLRCPVAMLHVPYAADGADRSRQVRYVADQLRDSVIPLLERLSGRPFDPGALMERLSRSARAEEDLVWILESARHDPSPIDAHFGAAYYVAPIFTAFRGTDECVGYYRDLRGEVAGRVRRGLGPLTPAGPLPRPRFRVAFEGPPSWTDFAGFWKLFADEGAVAVASTYAKVGGLYDRGFRHDPSRPLETLAEYCLGCYTNLSLPRRARLLSEYVQDFRADAVVVHSVKSCKSFSVGQLPLLEEVERRTGVPGLFLESDLVDSRYVSESNLRNRVESYFQMLARREPR